MDRELLHLIDSNLPGTVEQAREGWSAAVAHQAAFDRLYREEVQKALYGLNEPAVILAGRPYAAFVPEVNLSVPARPLNPAGDAPWRFQSPPANRAVPAHLEQNGPAAGTWLTFLSPMALCHPTGIGRLCWLRQRRLQLRSRQHLVRRDSLACPAERSKTDSWPESARHTLAKEVLVPLGWQLLGLRIGTYM
jgi:hypothetical protein